eukprot:52618_1
MEPDLTSPKNTTVITNENISIQRNNPKTIPVDKPANKSFVFTTSPKDEFYIIFNQFIWITMQMLFEIVPGIFQMQLLGHLSDGEYYLAGVGLAKTFANVIGRAQAWGLTTGLFTLLPQCIGANKYELISEYIQRSFYITTFTCILLSIPQIFAGDILVAIGQSKDLKHLINQYCRVYIGNAFFNIWLTIIQRLMQALNHNRDITFAQIFSFAISYPLYYLLIYYFDLKAIGGALGASILSLIMLLGCCSCLIYRGYGYVFKPISISIVLQTTKVKEYIYLSLPGLFQNAFEWIILEIATLLAGYLISPQIAISTTVIMGNLLGFMIAFAFGIANSTNIRVGGYIGAQKLKEAKRAAFIGVLLNFIVNVAFATVYYFFHSDIPKFWTKNEETISTASDVILYVMIPFNICCLTLQTFGGIYRGLGQQKISAYFVVFGYWVVSFPLSLILLFGYNLRHNVLHGSYVIWSSLCLGNGIGAICCVMYMIFKIDWNKAVDHAKSRMGLLQTDDNE